MIGTCTRHCLPLRTLMEKLWCLFFIFLFFHPWISLTHSFFGWGGDVLGTLLMVCEKVGLPRPLIFFRGSGMEAVEFGRFLVCWGNELEQGLSSSLGPLSSSCFLWDWWCRELLLLEGRVDHNVHRLVAVAKFIVIPGNELDKIVTESSATPSIKVEEWVSLLKLQETTWSSV